MLIHTISIVFAYISSTPPSLIELEMVSGLRIDGGTQILPARVRKTIQSIKEIVGNHSDADIYTTLKETNMDPNETAQKLLNQGFSVSFSFSFFFPLGLLFFARFPFFVTLHPL